VEGASDSNTDPLFEDEDAVLAAMERYYETPGAGEKVRGLGLVIARLAGELEDVLRSARTMLDAGDEWQAVSVAHPGENARGPKKKFRDDELDRINTRSLGARSAVEERLNDPETKERWDLLKDLLELRKDPESFY
jgi:hypothetical protein